MPNKESCLSSFGSELGASSAAVMIGRIARQVALARPGPVGTSGPVDRRRPAAS